MSTSSGEPRTSRTWLRVMPGRTFATCSLVSALPCTTSTRYGVMTPSRLSDDCSEEQPATQHGGGTNGEGDSAHDGAAERKMTGTILAGAHHDQGRRTQEQRAQGHAAAAQDPRAVPARAAAPHDGRRRLPPAARRGLRHRAGDRLPRADAVRAGRHPVAQPLRVGPRRVRAERRQASRPPGLPRLRPCRGVLRRRDREAPAAGGADARLSACRSTRWRCTPPAPRRTASTSRRRRDAGARVSPLRCLASRADAVR